MFDISPVGELCKVGLSSNWSFSSLRYHYLFFSQRELSKLTSPCFRLLRWTRHVSSDVSEWIIAHLRHNSVALLTHGRTCRLSGGYGCRKVCRALLFVLINSWYGFPQTCWLSCFHFFFLLSYSKNSIVTLMSLSPSLFSFHILLKSHTDCETECSISWSRYLHCCFLHHESASLLWSLAEEPYRVAHCSKSDNKFKTQCCRLNFVLLILGGY